MFLAILNDRRTLLVVGMAFLLFGLLPLVWVRLFGTQIAPYHAVGFLVIAILPFVNGFLDAAKRVFATGSAFWLATGVLVLAMLLSYTRSVWVYDPFFFIKFIGFFSISMATAVLVYLVIQRKAFPILAFLPAATGAIFILFMSVQFTFASIDPFELIALAVTRVEPNIIIHQLFRAAFAATNEEFEVRANLKQTLALSFIATIPIGYLALAYLPKGSHILKGVAIAGILFAVFMTIIPFSRAAWLSLFMMGACLALAKLRTTQGFVALLAGLLVFIPILLVIASDSSLVALLEARLDSDVSVDVRVGASEAHWQAIGASPFFGIGERLDTWAHNVVIDAWSAFGLVGLAGALLSLVALVAILVTALTKTLTAPSAERRVHAVIAASLCPALVRMFTAPNVTIDFPVWVALGVGIGVAADAWKRKTVKAEVMARSARHQAVPAE